jgi:hypothetical protein
MMVDLATFIPDRINENKTLEDQKDKKRSNVSIAILKGK